MSIAVEGLGDDSTVIRLTRADCLIGLTRDELSLVKSLGTGRRIAQVIERSDLPAPVVLGLIASLYERNVITKVQLRAAPDSRPPASVPPGVSAHVAGQIEQEALAEVNDLDAATRRALLEMEARLDSTDLFFVLGIPRAAEPSAVKQHYYDLCRRFHPDRFVGKSLGSFQRRVEKIFARLSDAQAVLTDPGRRAQYLARYPQLARPEAAARGAAAESQAQERRQRLRRHPFMRQQLQRAQLVNSGRAAFLKGDFLRACLELEAAEKLGALDPETSRWLEEARHKTPQKRG